MGASTTFKQRKKEAAVAGRARHCFDFGETARQQGVSMRDGPARPTHGTLSTTKATTPPTPSPPPPPPPPLALRLGQRVPEK